MPWAWRVPWRWRWRWWGARGADPTPSDSSPPVTPTPSVTSVSPTPSPSVSVPEAARAHTQEGGIEFATFYATEASDAYFTQDASTLRGLALGSCTGCLGIADAVDRYRDGDVHVRERRLTLVGAQASSPFAESGFDVDVIGTESASAVVNSSGTMVQDAPEAQLYVRVTLVWTDNAWRVAQLASVHP